MKTIALALGLIALTLTSSTVNAQAPLGPLISGMDFSGSYQPGRQQDAGLGTAAGALVDYGGISLNDASRLYALSWPASRHGDAHALKLFERVKRIGRSRRRGRFSRSDDVGCGERVAR